MYPPKVNNAHSTVFFRRKYIYILTITDGSRLPHLRQDDGHLGQAGAVAAAVVWCSLLRNGPELERDRRSACTIPLVYICITIREHILPPQDLDDPFLLPFLSCLVAMYIPFRRLSMNPKPQRTKPNAAHAEIRSSHMNHPSTIPSTPSALPQPSSSTLQ